MLVYVCMLAPIGRLSTERCHIVLENIREDLAIETNKNFHSSISLSVERDNSSLSLLER